jgi:hypothetical protein
MGLHRFATRHDLDRFATKQELDDLRETTAQGFADLRRHMDLAVQELASTIAVLLDRLVARIEAADARDADRCRPGEGPGDADASAFAEASADRRSP